MKILHKRRGIELYRTQRYDHNKRWTQNKDDSYETADVAFLAHTPYALRGILHVRSAQARQVILEKE